MIKYRFFGLYENYIDAIGNYVYVSVHVRGTSVNFQKEGGFLLSNNNLQNINEFSDKNNMPSFRNDFTSLRCESIDECIEKLNNKNNYITYEQLIEILQNEETYNLDEYDRLKYGANIYKYNELIKRADKIYFDKLDGDIFIIMNHKKILEELDEINNYCKNNTIKFHWV
jgi:hypothetical protein